MEVLINCIGKHINCVSVVKALPHYNTVAQVVTSEVSNKPYFQTLFLWVHVLKFNFDFLLQLGNGHIRGSHNDEFLLVGIGSEVSLDVDEESKTLIEVRKALGRLEGLHPVEVTSSSERVHQLIN